MGNSKLTRETIIEKGFDLIYKKGYQATSIDEIIATTKVTKGAFFYHFENKEEMGLAVINEFIGSKMGELFGDMMQNMTDPVKGIYQVMHTLLLKTPFMKVEYGCPVHNFIQEMGGINKTFNQALRAHVEITNTALVHALSQAKKTGLIRKNVSEKSVVIYVMSGYGGVRNLGKLYKTDACYKVYLKELKYYLESLRP